MYPNIECAAHTGRGLYQTLLDPVGQSKSNLIFCFNINNGLTHQRSGRSDHTYIIHTNSYLIDYCTVALAERLCTHHPHRMLLHLLFIPLCYMEMWNTSQINNWVMLCAPLSKGLDCSGEIKGVLWRLRHRSGTKIPWGLWKQKRGITANQEIGKKINKIWSHKEGKWDKESGSEQNISSVW